MRRAAVRTDWADAVRIATRDTIYDEQEILEAAIIAKRGHVATAATPSDFLATALWCSSGELNLAGYLATVEEFSEEGSVDRITREWKRDRRVGFAAKLLIAAGLAMSLLLVAALVLIVLDVVGVR